LQSEDTTRRLYNLIIGDGPIVRKNTMKTVIAIDSFKGSMTSIEAGEAAKTGIIKVIPDADVIVKPLADGGEGTTEALISGLGGELVSLKVCGPLGADTIAEYGILEDKTCVMEMAQASGIILVDRDKLNPAIASTIGVGQMIMDAIEHGCRKFIIGIGGSATSDGGSGMLTGLGFKLLNKDNEPISPGICELDQLARIDASNVPTILSECEFKVACDVNNPLCGERGAVAVFGPQKGVKPEEVELFDEKMKHFAMIAEEYSGKKCSKNPGAGAAGGLGFAFLNFLENVELKSGAEIVFEAINLEEEIKDADIVITGEGRLDGQTAMGKVPSSVAKLAKKYGAKVFAFAGAVTEDACFCNDVGIDAFFPIIRGVCTLDGAMDNETARHNMTLAVEQVFRVIKTNG